MGLTIMKTMEMSGQKPARMFVLFAATGTECGYWNRNYDWSRGATYAVRAMHADWAGKTAAFLNAEYVACNSGALGFMVSDELAP